MKHSPGRWGWEKNCGLKLSRDANTRWKAQWDEHSSCLDTQVDAGDPKICSASRCNLLEFNLTCEMMWGSSGGSCGRPQLFRILKSSTWCHLGHIKGAVMMRVPVTRVGSLVLLLLRGRIICSLGVGYQPGPRSRLPSSLTNPRFPQRAFSSTWSRVLSCRC